MRRVSFEISPTGDMSDNEIGDFLSEAIENENKRRKALMEYDKGWLYHDIDFSLVVE